MMRFIFCCRGTQSDCLPCALDSRISAISSLKFKCGNYLAMPRWRAMRLDPVEADARWRQRKSRATADPAPCHFRGNIWCLTRDQSVTNAISGARSCCQNIATPCSSCERRTQVRSNTPASSAPVITRDPNSRRQVSALPPTSRCSLFHEFLGPLLTLHSSASRRPSFKRIGKSHLAPATLRSLEKALLGNPSKSVMGLRAGSKLTPAASRASDT